MINLAVANLKARIISELHFQGTLSFAQLMMRLKLVDEKRLDNALQDLRKTGQIYFKGPKDGWAVGRGAIYAPMRRNARKTKR